MTAHHAGNWGNLTTLSFSQGLQPWREYLHHFRTKCKNWATSFIHKVPELATVISKYIALDTEFPFRKSGVRIDLQTGNRNMQGIGIGLCDLAF